MAEWRITGFEEVRRLGEGAQGQVVLARHTESGTPVAIKYLPAGAAEADRERLRHEARMLGQADSPHVARLFRLVEAPEGVAIVMEAVDGVSLKEVLERHGPLGPEASLSVLKGSLLGLAAAHALGVVHRDYKPANVVVPADGRSKLVDFGIATPAGEEAGGAGTPHYMAPEQWKRHIATPATDVYAATCVFVECLTGSRPYTTSSRAALMHAHLTAPIPVEAVPEPLRALVAGGMAKTPEDRPIGAAVFVEELERSAREAYGDDWETRGVQAIAVSAVALAALFPLAAWVLPGAGAAVGTGAGAATAGAAGAGAVGSAGAGTAGAGTAGAGTAGAAGSSSLAAGHTAAVGKAASVGGKASAGAVKAFFGSGAGITAASTGVAVVVAGGAFTAREVTKADPRPTPTVSRSAAPAVTVAAVNQCRTLDPGGRPIPAGTKPAPVRLPVQVKLPAGAAVYSTGQGGNLIGNAGASCEGSIGASGGSNEVGRARTGLISQVFQTSLGGLRISLCQYFPDSPQADEERGSGNTCASDLSSRDDLPTGVSNFQAMLSSDPRAGGRKLASPYVSVTLATLSSTGIASPISCSMPWAKAPVCTAALTYWFVQNTAKSGIAKADLDRVAGRIAAHVAASRH
ncbi:serine/threonine-protein kinase [Actinomadura xylanilytica]|uniref:serine/threonine-protein kinase n=1 Tax=Actinomadura xylanilytica TaxID=887459 RepID=UPI00255A8818|nr:serine/threonine-protein kinase [Actinomadura xylanilytica]MDL4777676.1 serine/threonine-protein kinase [Actinomadura xylanilytica]